MTDKQHFNESTPLRLASRTSSLAMAQADIVCALLAPMAVTITGIVTQGDQVLDRPLVEVGGKGVFIKQLEQALLADEADAAIHSMKDMETTLAPQTSIAAVLPRADVRDALVGADSLNDLPHGAHIGTASVRRSAWLKYHRPDLQIGLLRGNVNSRLARLQAGEFDAIILATAGLQRLALDVAYTPIDIEVMPPAAAQGALALQVPTATKGGQAAAEILARLHDPDTGDCVAAERAMLACLDGSCRTPISAYATLQDDQLHLYGAVLSADGQKMFETRQSGDRTEAAVIGKQAGAELLAACGGPSFLA